MHHTSNPIINPKAGLLNLAEEHVRLGTELVQPIKGIGETFDGFSCC